MNELRFASEGNKLMFHCNLCGFECPADEIGAPIMKAHLEKDHGINVDKRMTWKVD